MTRSPAMIRLGMVFGGEEAKLYTDHVGVSWRRAAGEKRNEKMKLKSKKRRANLSFGLHGALFFRNDIDL